MSTGGPDPRVLGRVQLVRRVVAVPRVVEGAPDRVLAYVGTLPERAARELMAGERHALRAALEALGDPASVYEARVLARQVLGL